MPERSSDSIGPPRTRGRDETRPRVQESIETLQVFGYGITEPDDRNIIIRDVKTISWLFPVWTAPSRSCCRHVTPQRACPFLRQTGTMMNTVP